MPRKRVSRIYWRTQGKEGVRRAYADFRDFADVGGSKESLTAPGVKLATDDPLVAEQLAARRLTELNLKRQRRALIGIDAPFTDLVHFVSHHLVEKKRSQTVTYEWLVETQRRLDCAIEFFGATRELHTITVGDVQKWMGELTQMPSGRRGKTRYTLGTVRHYLNALSNLYKRAASEGYVPAGYNPVAAMLDKPVGTPAEAQWLEVHDAALLLESARLVNFKRTDTGTRAIYPLLATFLLTGGRVAEVMGLEDRDLSHQ